MCPTDSCRSKVRPAQNAAGRLIAGARRSDHITPMLRQLHCLPVHFKLAWLVHQPFSGHAPTSTSCLKAIAVSFTRSHKSFHARTTSMVQKFFCRRTACVGPYVQQLAIYLLCECNDFKRQWTAAQCIVTFFTSAVAQQVCKRYL